MTTFGTPEERFQERFSRRVSEARHLSELLSRAMPESVPGDLMPQSTVFRLLLSTVPLYHAAALALTEAETTLGALVLMRSLIETWAHLFFIEQGEPRARPCRALQLERGWAVDVEALAKAAEKEKPGELSKAERRKAEVLDLWNRLGCPSAKVRRYGDVGPTIKQIERKLGIDWLYPTWLSASQMAHVGGWDWLLVDRGDGSSVAVLPPPSHRAARLNHLVVLFSNLSYTALLLLGIGAESQAAMAFHAAAIGLLDDKFLGRAMEGDFDG